MVRQEQTEEWNDEDETMDSRVHDGGVRHRVGVAGRRPDLVDDPDQHGDDTAHYQLGGRPRRAVLR